MAYAPPAYNAVNFNAPAVTYTPPAYNAVNFADLSIAYPHWIAFFMHVPF